MNEPEGIRERLLASARRQLAAIEAELGAAQAKGAVTEEALRLTRQHAGNLEALRDALQQRVAELDRQCAHLTAVIAARDATIATLRRAEARQRAMESSFSWRVTAPLRALRRALK
jgi:chromosome segregation ATPase